MCSYGSSHHEISCILNRLFGLRVALKERSVSEGSKWKRIHFWVACSANCKAPYLIFLKLMFYHDGETKDKVIVSHRELGFIFWGS